MSEYWKSTPKYWCKHCSTFVRDTKLEKANHEATPKHQGNLKRFLRDLHRGHEKDEKDKERAKSEVARLNGLVTGGGSAASASSSNTSSVGLRTFVPRPQATPSQRKQQLAQLAEMGVAIPDEFRPDMAMVGEWQVTSERIVDEHEGEIKPEALALGVRKRQRDEEEEEALEAKKKSWGSSYKTFPDDNQDADLDALLSTAKWDSKNSGVKNEDNEAILHIQPKAETPDPPEVDLPAPPQSNNTETIKSLGVKEEPSEGGPAIPDAVPSVGVKTEGGKSGIPGVVFKKRKTKNIRQR